jgi:translocation and assembly module TamB
MWRLLASLGLYVLSVAAVLALVLAALWWLLHTEGGTTWLLARLPGVQVVGAHGAVLGDFEAQGVEIALPGGGAKLHLRALSWHGLRFESAPHPLWLRVVLAELRVARVDLALADADPSALHAAPTSLYLPVEFDLAALRIDELHIDPLGAEPLRDLRAHLHLGAQAGTLHRIDDLHVAWDRLHAEGKAQVGTHGGLALDASIELTQQLAAAGEWGATATLSGPLATPQLLLQLRAQPTPSRPAQSLDASAMLHPFARWPLGDLQASAKALDLSALHSAAPATALDIEATVRTLGLDQPAMASVKLNNRSAGRWNEARLPLRELRLALRARPDDPSHLELQDFEALLGTDQGSAGRLTGSGRWNPAQWQLDARLEALRPAQLDARAPQMSLQGRVTLTGSGFDAATPEAATVDLRGDLTGQMLERGAARPVQLKLDARLNALRIELREALAQAGGAKATLSGLLSRATRDAGWSAKGQLALRDFDPLPWWPGPEDSAWRQGTHRLNAHGDFELGLPPQAPSFIEQLTRSRGQAQLSLDPSQLAGVPLSGSLSLQSTPGAQAVAHLQLDASGNALRADGRLGTLGDRGDDSWELKAEMPSLQRLQPLWRLLQGGSGDARLAGSLNATAHVAGRWPRLSSQGQLEAGALRIGAATVQRALARWRFASSADAPLEAQIDLRQVAYGDPSAESVQMQMKGTLRSHTLELRAESKALPPQWVETLQAAPAGAAAKHSLALLQAQGGAVETAQTGFTGWRGSVQRVELRGDAPGAPAWADARDIGVDLQWARGPARASVDAGHAELMGAVLRWNRIAWQAADPGRTPAMLDAQVQLDPLDVAPLLARAQPKFGWGGDLRLSGRMRVQSAPQFSADVVLERSTGDLSVTDESGTRSLGLSDLRVGLNAREGVWSFTTGVAGKTLGQAAGAAVARTSAQATWPSADTPLQGVLELRVADLGVWGPWLPPGWRLLGEMRVGASIGGQFGSPEYTGELTGKGLGVRNPLQGVDVHDGDVAITLKGDSARIEHFSARAGAGSLELQGEANLGGRPRAEITLKADKFQLLGRVDRRIVTSGEATLKLGRDTLALDGQMTVDEGLIDFNRSDAPRLSDDVQVRRGEGTQDDTLAAAAAEAAQANAKGRDVSVNLRVSLGDKLRVRGQGLDTGLRGDLHIAAPQGRLRVDGSVRAVDGTYKAYRQKLNIDRGVLTFNGPVENPQLDIEATRPNLDVRVGVAVTGTVLVPRVRLFSDPEMSDADKLSWLLRGRASEGQGSGDTALLQAAAMALLAGDESSSINQAFSALGLDELSLSVGEASGGGTMFSVGRQLSRNWYIGYERSLNATTGSWQLIYRIAQRFTVRVQSGEANSIDLIWTWRWQ